MADPLPTFSESWYRLADQRISLRPGVKIGRQFFRGELWHVLEDPFNNQFFRLQPAAYAFVGRLKPDRTVQQVWQECLDKDPNQAPGQEEVLRLISQLYYANLLQYESPADAAQLFERQKRRRDRETRSRWLNIMFLRIPLFDPDEWINKVLPFTRFLLGWFGALIWLGVVGWGAKVAIDNFQSLREQSQSILAPDNIILLYLGLVLVKTCHEFGHAFMCKKYGGEVHVIGVMMLIFTPTPYMDATSSWGFRNRWHRVLVGVAGMIVELFFAAIAVFIWANTGPGTLHNLCYNMIFVASVSTILFNGNPLLRYDGYYILSDLLGIPNLYQRATQQLKFWIDRYLFSIKKAESPARTMREGFWLSVYGVLSWIYRLIVFGGILLFVADRFLLIGIIMAVACLVSWVVVPVGKFVHYLATSPELERNRPQAVAVSLAVVGGIFSFLWLVPMPSHFRAPGIVEAREKAEVLSEASGIVDQVFASPGTWVTNRQPLLRLRNEELQINLRAAAARLEEVQSSWRRALQTNIANLKPLEKRLDSTRQQIRRLEMENEALLLIAPQDGYWAAPEIKDFVGRWMHRGSNLGLVAQTQAYYFTATVAQDDVNLLFASQLRGATIRLRGQAGLELPAGELRIIPAAQNTLPSPALGWRAGGEVPTKMTDPEGRQAAEPFFEVKALLPSPAAAAFRHGRSGKIRFNLDPEPLLKQWLRRLRQLLQKRYQL